MCFNPDATRPVNETLEELFKMPQERQQEILRELFSVNYSDDLEGDLQFSINQVKE